MIVELITKAFYSRNTSFSIVFVSIEWFRLEIINCIKEEKFPVDIQTNLSLGIVIENELGSLWWTITSCKLYAISSTLCIGWPGFNNMVGAITKLQFVVPLCSP